MHRPSLASSRRPHACLLAVFGALIISLSGAGCALESEDERKQVSALSFDKREMGMSANVLWPSSCDEVVGMDVCDPAYWEAEYQCGYDSCIAMGATHAEAQQCGDAYYDMGQSACQAVEEERELCESGLADCPWYTGDGDSGGAGGGSEDDGGAGEEQCTWCDCYGEHMNYHGEVCGTSADALIDECWDSCW